jgi:thiamine biosynthesis lipoprotein
MIIISVQNISRPPVTVSRLRVGLGTFIAVDAEADCVEQGESGVRAAFTAIARVDTLLHPSRHGSDLAAINAAAPGVRLTVHAWTWQILALSKRLHRLSRGMFDPCLPAGAGTLADLELIPRTGAEAPGGEPPGGEPPGVITRARLALDLGGIGKGFAVDRAIEALRAAGCYGGLVNAGGDLAVFGPREHTLFCRDARGVSTGMTLRNSALASSDVTGEARPREHRGYYDGRSGQPIITGRVAVAAPGAAVADALTKCLLTGSAGTAALLVAFGARRVGW